MLIKSGWKFQFALAIEVDEESNVVPLLKEILEQVERGQMEGRNYSNVGIYDFSLIEWSTQRKETEKCTTNETD